MMTSQGTGKNMSLNPDYRFVDVNEIIKYTRGLKNHIVALVTTTLPRHLLVGDRDMTIIIANIS